MRAGTKGGESFAARNRTVNYDCSDLVKCRRNGRSRSAAGGFTLHGSSRASLQQRLERALGLAHACDRKHRRTPAPGARLMPFVERAGLAAELGLVGIVPDREV